ncbi:hypothetical protein VTN00DRAFT_5760 [Thermoascus crustaceus]|uniref:uncharacterized protein n=1 Tax=Thermoascus crustaceus TaxID=5088 RepID=UPI003743C44A
MLSRPPPPVWPSCAPHVSPRLLSSPFTTSAESRSSLLAAPAFLYRTQLSAFLVAQEQEEEKKPQETKRFCLSLPSSTVWPSVDVLRFTILLPCAIGLSSIVNIHTERTFSAGSARLQVSPARTVASRGSLSSVLLTALPKNLSLCADSALPTRPFSPFESQDRGHAKTEETI